MDLLLEKILIYSAVIIFCLLVIFIYLRRQLKRSRATEKKILEAKAEGLYEPVSLYPVVDPNSCIKTGACIAACPEKDILGIVNGKATTINASRCIGHGACFHACPTKAITLCIGTEKRGADLPHVKSNFETTVPGIFIAGELGGMGLIKNAVEQGKQAVGNIMSLLKEKHDAEYDLIIIGAGPAGISATLAARKNNLKCITLEQSSLGGTVFTFPRSKIVMTSAMDLPLYGKVKLYETSKSELLDLWTKVLDNHDIHIKENEKIEEIKKQNGHFLLVAKSGNQYTSRTVLLAIGRRGSPRKLNVPGEESEKVAYRLLEPEQISGKEILIVGGGDSAVESALMLADHNNVTLSYRKENFSRIKPANSEKVRSAISGDRIKVMFNSNVISISDRHVFIKIDGKEEPLKQKNDLVYIFAGGELPNEFLKRTGIEVTTKFGDAILKH